MHAKSIYTDYLYHLFFAFQFMRVYVFDSDLEKYNIKLHIRHCRLVTCNLLTEIVVIFIDRLRVLYTFI